MDERDFLRSYDAAAFPPVAVAVDLVAIATIEQSLQILLIQRTEHPARGKWALPGGLLQPDETLADCAARTAREKVRIERVRFRQFQAFSEPQRDPRLRVVSIGYLGLVTSNTLRAATTEHHMLGILRWNGEAVSVRGSDGRSVRLAFDHDAIVNAAAQRLRSDLDRTTDVYALLPDEFTLRELQIVHEAIRNESLNKPAFRKRMLDSGRLEPVGRKDVGGAYRPAELYRLRKGAR